LPSGFFHFPYENPLLSFAVVRVSVPRSRQSRGHIWGQLFEYWGHIAKLGTYGVHAGGIGATVPGDQRAGAGHQLRPGAAGRGAARLQASAPPGPAVETGTWCAHAGGINATAPGGQGAGSGQRLTPGEAQRVEVLPHCRRVPRQAMPPGVALVRSRLGAYRGSAGGISTTAPGAQRADADRPPIFSGPAASL
jgi:hypothetical protein